MREQLALVIIKVRRTIAACNFKKRLDFNINYVYNTKEQTVSEAMKDAFEGENMQTKYSVLGYIINLYFHD